MDEPRTAMAGSRQGRESGRYADSAGDTGAVATGERASWLLACVATIAAAAPIGAFFGSLTLAHQIALENAATVPATSWLRSFRDWLPFFFIGFGMARLVAGYPAASTALRGLSIGAVGALATSLALFGPGLIWLPSAAACLIGVALGLHCDSARRAGSVGVLAAGLLAAASAFAVIAVPQLLGLAVWCPSDVLGVSLCAVLLALVLEPATLAPVLDTGSRWRLLALGWIAVALLAGYTAVHVGADQWVLLSGMLAAAATAAAAGRLALALGATAAAALLTTGVLAGLTSWLGGEVLGAGVSQSTGSTSVLAKTPDGVSSQLLRQNGAATAVYVRKSQELQLRLRGEIVAAAGPDRGEEPLLKAIVHAAAHDGDRVLLLGSGTGRVENSLRNTKHCDVETVTTWPELAALTTTVMVDGPVARPHDADVALPKPWHTALANLPSGSRQVLVLSELPTAATAHRATLTFQRQLRRVVGDGLVCQPIALDRVSVALLESWFDVVAEAHPWNGLYAVGNAAVLVSAIDKPTFRGGFASWGDEARWAMHEAHLAGPEDLELAFFGAVTRAEDYAASRATSDHGELDVARLLMCRLALPDDLPVRSESSILSRWQSQCDEMLRAKARLLTLPNDASGRAQAQSIAAHFLPVGAPAPWLQAALGLAGEDSVALRDASIASRCAFAMDPTFFLSPAAVYATLPLPNQLRGDLEDLFLLEAGERLVQRCSGSSPRAVAVRTRFASRCARSLVGQLAQGPLSDDAAMALRELADPFVLREVAAMVVPAGRWHELLTFWRADLPMPSDLLQVVTASDLPDQLLLAKALRGRRDPSCYPVIAEFLVSEHLELRLLAGEALRLALSDRIAFDAHWPRSRRLDAATRLRDLHNRKP